MLVTANPFEMGTESATRTHDATNQPLRIPALLSRLSEGYFTPSPYTSEPITK